jgi:hypothetical protein
MVNATERHKKGVSIVADKLRELGIKCKILAKSEGDSDIVAKANNKIMKIRVRATKGDDTEFKYDLGKYPIPEKSLYYVFVLLKTNDIFPFTSQYIVDHPCTAKSERKAFRFYAKPYETKKGFSNMRVDYQNARNNNTGIFLSYFGLE